MNSEIWIERYLFSIQILVAILVVLTLSLLFSILALILSKRRWDRLMQQKRDQFDSLAILLRGNFSDLIEAIKAERSTTDGRARR